jgi:hypothetical protein
MKSRRALGKLVVSPRNFAFINQLPLVLPSIVARAWLGPNHSGIISPRSPSSMCGFRSCTVIVQHRNTIKLIDHDGLVSATQIGPLLLSKPGVSLRSFFVTSTSTFFLSSLNLNASHGTAKYLSLIPYAQEGHFN